MRSIRFLSRPVRSFIDDIRGLVIVANLPAAWRASFRPTLNADIVSVRRADDSFVHVVTFSRETKNFWSDPRFDLVRGSFEVVSFIGKANITIVGDEARVYKFHHAVAQAMNCNVGRFSRVVHRTAPVSVEEEPQL